MQCHESSYDTLPRRGNKKVIWDSYPIELLSCTMGHCKLTSDIDNMNLITWLMSDDMICSLRENNKMRCCTLFNLFKNMSHFLQYFEPWLFSSVSLTMKDRLSAKSPFALANFGSILISSGNVSDGYWLGEFLNEWDITS